ncbi:ATP-binding protein [Kitasatospora herbaricolor]|uniref:ATP-binding protein n=1 Tax=Kitasatospora herbaricolor TaxID=68217 RepID=A0ABZ1W5I9_9ACTN|nr:ATP-binding protein [Kitasatospora herbaricolor]
MPGILEKPPASADEYACWLPRHRRSGSAARRLLREFLAGRTGGERYVLAAESVLTELVNNAVQHARTPHGRLVMIRFELRPGQLRVEVHDAGDTVPTPRTAGAEDEGGRGLRLVEQLSTGWGCHPRAGGVGKVVWATVGPAGGDAR